MRSQSEADADLLSPQVCVPGDPGSEARFQFVVAMDWNRDDLPNAGCAEDVMATVNSFERPARPLQFAAEFLACEGL
jgi:hypothetical protein